MAGRGVSPWGKGHFASVVIPVSLSPFVEQMIEMDDEMNQID
jgi:hypothetical protein